MFILTLAFVTEHFLASENVKQTCIFDITMKKKSSFTELLSCQSINVSKMRTDVRD